MLTCFQCSLSCGVAVLQRRDYFSYGLSMHGTNNGVQLFNANTRRNVKQHQSFFHHTLAVWFIFFLKASSGSKIKMQCFFFNGWQQKSSRQIPLCYEFICYVVVVLGTGHRPFGLEPSVAMEAVQAWKFCPVDDAMTRTDSPGVLSLPGVSVTVQPFLQQVFTSL